MSLYLFYNSFVFLTWIETDFPESFCSGIARRSSPGDSPRTSHFPLPTSPLYSFSPFPHSKTSYESGRCRTFDLYVQETVFSLLSGVSLIKVVSMEIIPPNSITLDLIVTVLSHPGRSLVIQSSVARERTRPTGSR